MKASQLIMGSEKDSKVDQNEAKNALLGAADISPPELLKIMIHLGESLDKEDLEAIFGHIDAEIALLELNDESFSATIKAVEDMYKELLKQERVKGRVVNNLKKNVLDSAHDPFVRAHLAKILKEVIDNKTREQILNNIASETQNKLKVLLEALQEEGERVSSEKRGFRGDG